MTSPARLPNEIWRTIFEYVAEDSRAYLIPLRCVCLAWKKLAQVVPAKFVCAMTRLLEVSARDCLPRLCNWAHEGGGVVGRDALIAVARTGNVDLVTLVHGWAKKLAISSLNPELLMGLRERQFATVFLNQTQSERLSPLCLRETYTQLTSSSIADDMLSAAAEVGSTETCRYLIVHGGITMSSDLQIVSVFAAIRDSVPMLELCETALSKRRFNSLLKQLIVLAARNGSHTILKIIEERKFYDSRDYWKLVFLGAAMGHQIALYDIAKSHLEPMWIHRSPIELQRGGGGPISLLGVALDHVMGGLSKEREPMIRKLVEDGNGATLSRLELFARDNDPTLGPLVIELGGVFDLRTLWNWEDLTEEMERDSVGSRKRRRAIPFDLSGIGDPSYLSD